MIQKTNLLLVGAGQMASEYAKVLKALDANFTVVGRSIKSAEEFYTKTGIKPATGGIESFLTEKKFSTLPDTAIIATNAEELAKAATFLIEKGIKKILTEKPAALTISEIEQLDALQLKKNATIYVAYNRRFYASVRKTKEIIAEDGGVSSFNFEFTEWSHVIEKANKPQEVKQKWFLANSTHVVDLAFYLGGKPQEISCYTSGNLAWHTPSAIFSGSGISVNNALFSYQANWTAPGRWGVEILTRKHRLILKPLEELWLQNIGSVNIEKVALDDKIDKDFKPGLYEQVKSFLNDDTKNMKTLHEQKEDFKLYYKIAGYK